MQIVNLYLHVVMWQSLGGTSQVIILNYWVDQLVLFPLEEIIFCLLGLETVLT